jgi:signal transduction histidine kinase
METKPFILIVDDMPRNLQVVGNILDNAGYRFTLASSGAQALKIVEKRLPDLILLDVMMPEMDGFEVCRKLKQSPETREVPVIFLTAKTESEDIARGFECGGIDFITKPFNSTEMLARIKNHLEIVTISRERKELLHILCHDLSNPLSSIATVLKVTEDSSRFEAVKKHLLSAVENGLQMIELVRNMRELEDNKFNLELDTVHLEEVVGEATALLKHRLEEKNIRLHTDIKPDITVRAERTSLLNSVIINLLTNAVKFSYPGSGISIHAEQKEDTVKISVRDSGIGMTGSLQRSIFDLKKPTTRPGTNGERGTGFGLPLVKKFVTAYNGTIDIVSKEKTLDSTDHGTEIIITLHRG